MPFCLLIILTYYPTIVIWWLEVNVGSLDE
jgi:hypothetical protein